MSAPGLVRILRRKGWRMPPGAVKVDRSTRWGNPFRVGFEATDQAHAASLFRRLIEQEGAFSARPGLPPTTTEDIRKLLRGKTLACWCKPGTPCHGLVLLEIANSNSHDLPARRA